MVLGARPVQGRRVAIREGDRRGVESGIAAARRHAPVSGRGIEEIGFADVAAIAADTKGPELLAWIGGAAGIPAVGALAALWRKKKWAQGMLDVVESVQVARGELDATSLATVDAALAKQSKGTQDLVKAIKKANGIEAVTT